MGTTESRSCDGLGGALGAAPGPSSIAATEGAGPQDAALDGLDEPGLVEAAVPGLFDGALFIAVALDCTPEGA